MFYVVVFFIGYPVVVKNFVQGNLETLYAILYKYCSSSSAIQGFPVRPLIADNPAGPGKLSKDPENIRHIIFTAETHNFPTGEFYVMNFFYIVGFSSFLIFFFFALIMTFKEVLKSIIG